MHSRASDLSARHDDAAAAPILVEGRTCWRKARAGEIQEFTGVSDPYESPVRAEVVVDTSVTPVAESVTRIRAAMET